MGKVRTFNIFIFFGLIISICIGMRLPDVGRDTEAYMKYFQDSSITEGIYDRFELGFSLLMQLFSKAGLSVEVFFSFIALVITIVYLYTFKRVYAKCFFGNPPPSGIITIFFSLLLLSSWYIASTTNGLRQGLALVFVYLALTDLFYNRKKISFILFCIVATLFHTSSLLIIPSLFLLYTRFRVVLSIWLLSGIGFVFGINELIVKFFSETFGVPIYESVKYYSLERGAEELGGGLYSGFIASFFIYTIFWPILVLILLRVKNPLKEKVIDLDNVYILLKIYFSLSLVYFFMGFGPFSNRYAVFSWFFIPIIQIVTFRMLFRLNFSNVFPIIMLFLSIIFFLYFRLDWVRFFIF